MNWSKNASFGDRLSAAAEAKKAQLEAGGASEVCCREPRRRPSSGRHGRRSGWLAMLVSLNEKPPS